MNTIDFLPQSYHEKRLEKQVKHRRWVLVLLMTMVLTGWAITRHQNSSELATEAESLEGQVDSMNQTLNEMDKLRRKRKTLTYQKEIQKQLDQPVTVTQTVAMLGRLMPDETGLTGLTVSTHRPPPKPLEEEDDGKKKRSKRKKDVVEEVPPDYISMMVQGIAPNDIVVSSLAEVMSDHPLFENVRMNYSRVDEYGDLITRKFGIGAEVPLDRRYTPLTTVGVTDED